MDTAKIVAVLLKQGGKVADWAIAKQLELYGAPRPNDHVPSIMVPTSSGTGSEVSIVAVFSYLNHAKDGVLAAPSIAIVDPEMTVTCPPLNTITSALDAFAHAAEAYTALDVDPVSDQLALEAIGLIMGNLEPLMKMAAISKHVPDCPWRLTWQVSHSAILVFPLATVPVTNSAPCSISGMAWPVVIAFPLP